MAKAQLTAKETKSLKSLAAKVEELESKSQAETQTQNVREKYWTELTVEEKIERMRLNVKNVDARVAEGLSRLNDLRNEIDMLFDHTHEEDGKLVIKVTKDQRHRLRTSIGGVGAALTPMGVSKSESYF